MAEDHVKMRHHAKFIRICQKELAAELLTLVAIEAQLAEHVDRV